MEKTCNKCPEMDILDNPRGVGYIVYTGGPPEAPFAAVRFMMPADDGFVRKYARPRVTMNGCIEYDPAGPQPPVPEGYTRMPHNPWTLCPIWASCVFRASRVTLHEDGYLQIEGQCLNPASGKKGYETLATDFCEACPARLDISHVRATPARQQATQAGPSQS